MRHCALVIGGFATIGSQALQQLLLRKPLGLVAPSLQAQPPLRLDKPDGLNIWYEARLLEVGVEDIQTLATTDIVDLMLNTRIPGRSTGSKSFLYLRVTDDKDRETLRSYGIRSATDLLDLFEDERVAKDYERLLNKHEDKMPSRLARLSQRSRPSGTSSMSGPGSHSPSGRRRRGLLLGPSARRRS